MSLLLPAGGATVTAPPVTRTFVGSTTNHSDLAEYTFSGAAISTAAADRRVLVMVMGSGGTNPIANSMTIGGVGATKVVESNDTGGNNRYCAIFIAAVPTGTTGDIVVTIDQTTGNCQINVYAVYGLQSETAIDTEGFAVPTGTAIDFPALSTSADGFGFWYVANGGGAQTFTWSDPTAGEDFDSLTGAPTGASSSGSSIATTGATLTEDATASGSISAARAIAASFR
jgi:hypothetical protein